MDIRTATQLCLIDLVAIIDRSDFRAVGEAERIIAEFAATAPDDRCRGALLGRLADALGDMAAPICPEADALSRAVRATVRRLLKATFERSVHR